MLILNAYASVNLLNSNFLFPVSDNFDNLKKLAEQFQKHVPDADDSNHEGDDDVPELVAGETFEEAANETQAP